MLPVLEIFFFQNGGFVTSLAQVSLLRKSNCSFILFLLIISKWREVQYTYKGDILHDLT
jgi:hypothetical protein